jgi:hypothetical protein
VWFHEYCVQFEGDFFFFLANANVVPLHVTGALGGRGGIAPTHSRPRH